MTSDRDKGDRVVCLLGLLEQAPGSADHIDDDTLTLIRQGAASSDELETARAHITFCPSCRRLVSQILTDSEVARAATTRPTGWRPSASGFLTWSAAACLLVGLSLVGWMWMKERLAQPPVARVEPGATGIGPTDKAPPIEMLVAQLELLPGKSRGETRAPLPEARGPQGSRTDRVPDGEDFFIEIKPPRDGVAVVLRVTPERWELLGRKRNQEFRVSRAQSNEPYGPVLSHQSATAYILVVTDFLAEGELSDTIRQSLPTAPAGIAAIDGWRSAVSSRLARGGHRWVSIEPILFEPAKAGDLTKPESPRASPEPR